MMLHPAPIEQSRRMAIAANLLRPLPSSLLVVAALAVAAEALAFDRRIIRLIAAVLPVDIAAPDPSVAIATAVGRLALAVGLRRGKRLAWWVAVATFASGSIAQALMLGHPIGAVIAAVCLLFLAADRLTYQTLSDTRWRGRFLGLLAIGLAAALAESAVELAVSGDWRREGFDIGDFVVGVVSWFAFGDPSATVPVGPGAIIAILPLAARLPVILGLVGILRPAPARPDPLEIAHARQVAERFGHGALLPFQLGSDKRQFSPPGFEGSVVFGTAGRMAVVVGDPIGPDGWLVFDAFLRECAIRDQVAVMYQATAAARILLEGHGFRTFQVGLEAIIDLPTFSLAGSRRANLRHTVTRARRGGIATSWHPTGLGTLDPVTRGQLVAIDEAWRSRTGPELGFTISQFDVGELEQAAVALAVDRDGRPQAFATFRPTGADGGWVLDLLRRSPGGVPGAMEACLVEAAERLRDEGCPTLSLGLAPLAGLRSDRGPFEERLLATAARLSRRLYDVDGLAFFKAKFDPRWAPRYGAVRSRGDLPGLVAGLLQLHLGSPRRAIAGALAATVRR